MDKPFYGKVLIWAFVIVISLMVSAMIIGGLRMSEEADRVKSCKPTELYITGYRGHTTRVYDCG